MSRNERQMNIARMMMSRPQEPFEQIDLSTAKNIPDGMTRAYKNNWYVVMIYDNQETTHGKAIRIMVQRHDDEPIHSWMDLQKIKNEIFGNEVVAIEYYPKQSELVDQHNIYWLWIFPEGVIPLPTMN